MHLIAVGISSAALQVAGLPPPPETAEVATSTEQPAMTMSSAELLDWAEAMERQQRPDLAARAYRALTSDPDLQVRSEARFRLGMTFAAAGQSTQAALLLRQILDEQPDAQRVRLELARVLEKLGDEAGARRALREAQAGGLPPNVARYVNRYAAMLRARKQFGASFEVALAPDSNIARATRFDTLETVLGEFLLDREAREQSGVGGALRGQAYGRVAVGENVNLFGRATASADIYRRSAFDDYNLGFSVGPELVQGANRFVAELGVRWRWFGGLPYSRTTSFAVNYLRPLDQQSQLRAAAGVGLIDNKRNPLQDGRSYNIALSYERALSVRTGVGATLAVERDALRDAGYSTTAGQLTAFGYRDMGAMTLIATAGYGRLEADERLFIYPGRRSDRIYRASLGVTFRQLTFGQIAPFIRLRYERNRSSINIFDYRRLRTEFGVVRAF